MKNIEEIYIWWEGSFSYNEIIYNKIDNKLYDNKATDIGLYAVYGNHILYGTDVLLYIGITTEQDFQTRLKDRWIIDNSSDLKNLKIYLGRIYSANEKIIKDEEKKRIKKAEALLVNVLKPAFNSSYINSVNFKKISNNENFIVFNHNSYKTLLPEVSTTRWWSYETLNFSLTRKLAKELAKKDEVIKIEDDEEFYGFDIDSDGNICLGVDYAYWDRKNIPLVIGIYKEALKDKGREDKFKELFSVFGEDSLYYFVSASDNLKSETVTNDIKGKIEKIKKILK